MTIDSLVSRIMDMPDGAHFLRSFSTSLLVEGFLLGLSRALHWRWHLPGGVAADNAVEVPCLREAHSKSRCVRCLQCPAISQGHDWRTHSHVFGTCAGVRSSWVRLQSGQWPRTASQGGVAADNAVEVPCLREAHSKSRCVRCLQCPALLKIFTFAPGAIFTSNSWVRSQEAGDRP